MPGTWDAETYRTRARRWREAAQALPPGKEHDTCVTLAESYANLAALIEQENTGKIGATAAKPASAESLI